MAGKLNWKGKEVLERVKQGLIAGMTEVGGEVVAAGQKQLYKGHGVITGTLRRSNHTASPGYNWDGDNSSGGGSDGVAVYEDGKVSIQVGSGMEYAMAVHQGHHSFEGYHWLTNAVDEVRPKAPDIIAKHIKSEVG